MSLENKKSIHDLIKSQRVDHKTSINKYITSVKSMFHPTEFKLIMGLKDGLESSLFFEYMTLASDTPDGKIPLYDVWSFDKICMIYREAVS